MLCQELIEESLLLFPVRCVSCLGNGVCFSQRCHQRRCAPHHGGTLRETFILSAHIPTASEGSLVKTFKMLKRLVFSRGNVNFGIRLTFALTPMSRLLVWSSKVPRAGSKTRLCGFWNPLRKNANMLMQKNNLESV